MNDKIPPKAVDGAGRQSEAGAQLRLGLREGLTDGWTFGNDETLADLVGSRTKGLGLFYVLVYIALWGRYRDLTGEAPPSNLAHATAMKMPHRTLARYRDRFHKAFPELDDPGPLYDLVRDQIDADASLEVVALKMGGLRL